MFGKKKVVYTPAIGAATLDRSQFVNTIRTRKSFHAYSNRVGIQPALIALDNAFTENLRCMGADGFWKYAAVNPHATATTLRFADTNAISGFVGAVDGQLDFDIDRMDRRGTYLQGLKAQALAAQLYTQLLNATEPEGNYYVAPPPAAPRPGAPAIPPKPVSLVNRAKGLAWLTHGVHGDTSAFSRMLALMARFDGIFPLGSNVEALYRAWRVMVPLAPAYRGWNNVATQQKYPSNIGGTWALGEVLRDMQRQPMPPPGDNRWYDVALYMLGTIITLQAFTDGNKRMSRFAYVLVLLSGGVPMRVPNNLLGSTLGDM